jgi:hypothetical protein
MDSKPDDKLKAMLGKDMCSGVEACHAKNIIHRDIKPDNFLIAKTSAGPVCKVADYGVSDIAPSGPCNQMMGTPAFMAPEMHNKQGYHLPVDIWATGCSIYMLVNGKHPFIKGPQLDFAAMNKGIAKGGGLFRGSSKGQDLAREMLMADPSKRPTARNSCDHAWFRGVARGKRAFDTGLLAQVEATPAGLLATQATPAGLLATQEAVPWTVEDRITYVSHSHGEVNGKVITCNADGSITIKLDGAGQEMKVTAAEADRIKTEEPKMPDGAYMAGIGLNNLTSLYPVGSRVSYVSSSGQGIFPGQCIQHLPDGSVMIQLDAGVRKKIRWWDAQRLTPASGSPPATGDFFAGERIIYTSRSTGKKFPGEIKYIHRNGSVDLLLDGAKEVKTVPAAELPYIEVQPDEEGEEEDEEASEDEAGCMHMCAR